MSFMKYLSCAMLFLLLSPTLHGSQVPAPVTENVIVVVLDGVRLQDAFETRPIRCKHIWNDLKPLGTAYAKYYNRGFTSSLPAHTAMLTGTWHGFPNAKFTPFPDSLEAVRAETPTLFEYMRKQKGLPRESGWYVGDNLLHGEYLAGMHPNYGSDYSGTIMNVPVDDTLVFRRLCWVMDNYRPNLILVNFVEADLSAHFDRDYELYLDIVETADSLAWEIWKKIQGMPPYEVNSYTDKTTLIVTSDHGRHSEDAGPWTGHGCNCEGCRHVMFVAVGPDTPADVIVNRYVDQIDVCPTVGALLQVDTPYSNGRVLSEMLDFEARRPSANEEPANDTRITQTETRSIDPDITDYQGVIHVVWSDDSTGNYETYYKRSTDEGQTWSETRRLSHSGRDARFPTVTADSTGVYVAWSDFREGTWHTWFRRSPNNGLSWYSEQRLLPDSDWGIVTPPTPVLTTDGNGPIGIQANFGVPRGGRIWHDFRLGEVFSFFTDDRGETWQTGALPDSTFYPFYPDIAVTDQGTFTVWHEFHETGDLTFGPVGTWDLFFSRSADRGNTWIPRRQLTSSRTYTLHPSVVARGLDVACAWADAGIEDELWQCYYKLSRNGGQDWTDARQLTSSSVGAWQAQLFKSSGLFGIVWAEFDTPEEKPKVCYRLFDFDTRHWGEQAQLSDEFSVVNHPAVSPLGYVVWEDYRLGNPEIYFSQIVP